MEEYHRLLRHVLDHGKRRVQLDCRCMVNGKKVLIGEATVLAPSGKFD